MNTQKKDQVAKRFTHVPLKPITIPTLVEPNKYFGNQRWKQLQCIPENKEAMDLIQWCSEPKDLTDTVFIFPQLLREGVTETVKDGVPCFSVPIQKGDNLSKLFGSDWRNIYNHAINKTFREAFPNPDRIDVQFPNEAPAIIYVPLKRTLPEFVTLQVPRFRQGKTNKHKTAHPVKVSTGETLPVLRNQPDELTVQFMNLKVNLPGACLKKSQANAKWETTIRYDQVEPKPIITKYNIGKSSLVASIELKSEGNEKFEIALDDKGTPVVSSTSTGVKLNLGLFTASIGYQIQAIPESQITFQLQLERATNPKKGVVLKSTYTIELSLNLFHLTKCFLSSYEWITNKAEVLKSQLDKLAEKAKELGEQIKPWIIPISIFGVGVIMITLIYGSLAALLGTMATRLISASFRSAPVFLSAAAFSGNKKTDKSAIPLCAFIEKTLPPELAKNAITVIPDESNICLKSDEDNESKP